MPSGAKPSLINATPRTRRSDGDTLSVVKDYLNDASSEVLEEIDRCSYYAWDVSGWGTIEEVLPFQVDPSYLVIHKASITNWEDYYAYRKTMFKLEGEIV